MALVIQAGCVALLPLPTPPPLPPPPIPMYELLPTGIAGVRDWKCGGRAMGGGGGRNGGAQEDIAGAAAAAVVAADDDTTAVAAAHVHMCGRSKAFNSLSVCAFPNCTLAPDLACCVIAFRWTIAAGSNKPRPPTISVIGPRGGITRSCPYSLCSCSATSCRSFGVTFSISLGSATDERVVYSMCVCVKIVNRE